MLLSVLHAAATAAQAVPVRCTNCGAGVLGWLTALGGIVGLVIALLALLLARASARDSASSASSAAVTAEFARQTAEASAENLELTRLEAQAAAAERARCPLVATENIVLEVVPLAAEVDGDPGAPPVVLVRVELSNAGTESLTDGFLNFWVPTDVDIWKCTPQGEKLNIGEIDYLQEAMPDGAPSREWKYRVIELQRLNVGVPVRGYFRLELPAAGTYPIRVVILHGRLQDGESQRDATLDAHDPTNPALVAAPGMPQGW